MSRVVLENDHLRLVVESVGGAISWLGRPDDVVETEAPVLLDYLDGGQVAVVTLNRPHADNAITTATFGQPEAMIGLAAGGGSPALLPRRCPVAKPCKC